MAQTIRDTPADATADDTAQATGANRRDHVRVTPDDKNQLAATLASGSNIRLIDLSRGGAQFECDRRFLPNATVSLRLLTRDGEVLVTGRVVRSRIVRLESGGLGYLVAVAFASPLQNALEGEEAARPAPAPPTSDPEPTPPSATAPVAPEATAALQLEPTASASTPAAEPTAGQRPAPETVPEPPPADITAEEALAFEATMELAPAMLTVTASVDSTSEQLHDMFDGNDW